MSRCLPLALAAALLAAPVAAPLPAEASADRVYTGFLSNTAAGGYDVVAYFTEGRPVEGSSAHTHEHEGVRWLFATAENRDAFAADPARYAPQYGGHCAWAVSQGYTAKGDPAHWRIVDGKLYLNYNASVQQRWEGDIPGFIASANRNWPDLLEE